MKPKAYASSLAAEGARLSAIADDAERSPQMWQRPVHSCPDWRLENLIEHCATVWSFVTKSIRGGAPADRASITRPEGSLSGWHEAAFSGLVESLNRLQPDEPVWTFDPDNRSAGFWWRRMTHEATMHRWDAESAIGAQPGPIDAQLAADGIEEMFDFFIPRRGRGAFAGSGETVHLHAIDAPGEWVITRTPEGMTVEREHRKADAAAQGSAADLMLFVWGRIAPQRLTTFGEVSLLTQWQQLVRF